VKFANYLARKYRRSASARGGIRLSLILLVICSSVSTQAATFAVNATTDAVDLNPGDGVCATAISQCTLRAAIQESNALVGTDIVNVPGGTYTLSITGTGEDSAATGDLDITADVVINGNAVSPTVIDANAIDRVMEVLGAGATISNLTIRNGNVIGNGGGISVDSSGSLTVTASTFTGSTADDDGGAISTDGGSVVLTNVTLSGNTGLRRGGGLNCEGPCTLTNVTVSANTEGADGGGGVRVRPGSATLTLRNTIIANNSSDDCDVSSVISLGNNLASDGSCALGGPGDQSNTDPLLNPLQNNGGPTSTHALLAGSPAINTGSNTGCPATDQRGVARPIGGTCDIGSFEGVGIAICPVTTTADSGAGSLRACLLFANSNPGTPVQFNIPGPGNRSSGGDSWWAITPLTPLPIVSAANILIDATTQTSNQGNTNSIGPEIELDGTSAGGASHGLEIGAAGDGSVIRGLMINRFGVNGIQIQSGANNVAVAGNWIGSDGSGASAPGNGNNGINLLGGNAIIGGAGSSTRNVINNNGNEGINLSGGGATGNAIRGNYIGLEYDGSTGLGNGDVGIALLAGAASNTIGGLSAATRNVISMNVEGIEINAANNVVIGNYIGTDAGGTLDRGNRSDDGLEIQSGGNNNTVGGTAAGAGNLIAFNQLHGINVAAGSGNSILGNVIHSNNQLGIDLGNDGVTANDIDDPDGGANGLQNYPEITSVTESGGNLTVGFRMTIEPGNYRVEFFTNAIGADPSNFGEGQSFAGAITVSDTGGGYQNFSHSFPGSADDIVSATTTQEFVGPSYGSTSEFSGNFVAVKLPVCPGGVVSNTTDSGNRSLRDCIQFANANPGTTISFDIGGGGNRSAGADTWHGISPLTPLPVITGPSTIIDGTTQTTNRGDRNSRGPEIEIDGGLAGAATDGLVIGAAGGNSTIRGLIIQNFSDNGIRLLDDSNLVAGNYIGIAGDGTSVAANNSNNIALQAGLRIESSTNTIGGSVAADRNVISGNRFAGIEIIGAGSIGNVVRGNFIGTDATGALDRGNSGAGIHLEFAVGNLIGGGAPGELNVISGNSGDGVEIAGGDLNRTWGNHIGTDLSGTVIIPNDRDGIDINTNGGDGATSNRAGGTGPDDGNLIRGNTLYGIQVRGAASINNPFLGNRIFGNGTLDIDNNDDGVTANDALDPDAGPNELLNFPEFVVATETGGIVSAYVWLDVPAGNYRLEFFSNPSGVHAAGNGGGEVFAGAVSITHGGAGPELFAHTFAGTAGDVITATVIENIFGPLYASTSEYSAPFTVTPATPFSARWPLDETAGVVAADIIAGNDGAYRNGVLLDQVAACADTGSGVYFDGTDDFVEVAHTPDYLMNEGTVTLWANVDVLGVGQGLFSKDSTDFDTGGHLTMSVLAGGDIEVRLQDTATAMVINSASISAGTWVHVAFSWGAGGMALYIDGSAPVTDSYVGGLGITSGGTGNFEPIAFGAATSVSDDLLVTPTSQHFAGFMDDVRIYNYALTLPEVQALANCTPAANHNIVKRAFWPDGTPIPTGATIPSGVEFKYLLYINNRFAAQSDVSVRDVLDPAFQYSPGTIQMDNSVAECAAANCTVVEEQVIFNAVNSAAFASDVTDGDAASYTGAGASVDAGDANAANAQLNINSDSVWAILFSAKMP